MVDERKSFDDRIKKERKKLELKEKLTLIASLGIIMAIAYAMAKYVL